MKQIFDKLPNQTKIFWILKAILIILSILIIFSGVAAILEAVASLSIQHLILAIYVIFFAIKIILCEIHLRPVLYMFPYMRSYIGKGLFLVFVGLVMISFGFGTFLVTAIFGIVMLLCGIGFIVLPFLPIHDTGKEKDGEKKGKKELRKRKKKGEKDEEKGEGKDKL